MMEKRGSAGWVGGFALLAKWGRMLRPRGGIAAILAGLSLGVCAQARAGLAPLGAPPRTLKTTHAIHSLTVEEARKAFPVHLRAAVSYYDCYIDVRRCALFVHDKTGSIFVALPSSFRLPLQEGSEVQIDGVSGAGDFAPIIEHPTITLTGREGVQYQAMRATLSELTTAMYDGQWVEVEGLVHSVVAHGRNVILRMATNEGMLSATTVREDGADYEGLVGATIRLRGNEAPQFNKRRQLIGVHMYFPSVRGLTVLHPSVTDPYLLPVQSINHLLGFVPGQALFQRTRVRGQVTLHWPGELLCVEDASGGLCVPDAGAAQLAEGTLVDVVGFPVIADSAPSLTDAVFRAAGAAAPGGLRPGSLKAQEAARGEHSGELVEMTGTLISLEAAASEDAPLMVTSNGIVFAARLPKSADGRVRAAWKQGSLVHLTGVAVAQVDTEGTDISEGAARFASFHLMLRSPADVAVLESPSWWNGPHTEMVLAGVALVTIAVVCWVVVLRRRVEEQTLVIRQSEERYRHLALHDSLTGLANRALLHDRLEVELARSRRNGTSFALLMLDLDKFKQVNDSLGHQVGDRLLCAAAERVQSSVRKTDTVARIGGDEFVVLLAENCEGDEPREVAGKIVTAMAAPLMVEGTAVPLSASVGICTYPSGGSTADVLLRNVDAALYEAKARGRNCLQHFVAAVAVESGGAGTAAAEQRRRESPPGALAVPSR